VELAEGAVLQNINFALPIGAVVAGRVVDEVGEPIAHVSVSLQRRRYVDGARRLVGESGASTDDRGEFRIFGAPPGDYLIVARFHGPDLGLRDRVRYVPTYYPGTAVASEAQSVHVAAGQEVAGITIGLARAATATIRGVVRSGQASFAAVAFVVARETNGPQAEGQTAMAVAGPDGAFALGGLLPGTYMVHAQSGFGGESASAEVVVEGVDVAGVVLSLSKGGTARGRIRFDSGSPPADLRPSQVMVMFAPLDSMGEHLTVGPGVEPPTPRDDWTFQLQGVRGRGFLRAASMGDWQMKRVLKEGVDVTDTPLDFTTDINGLEIELTQAQSTVAGGVVDDRGDVAVDATVVVFADDPEKWGPRSRFVESARPDQKGRFTVRGLPPGHYLAVAVEYLQPGEERDPEVLETLRKDATRFTLSEGEKHELTVRLVKL
jgi:hypothetical protein